MPRTPDARERIIAVLAKGPRRRVEDIAVLVELSRQNCSKYLDQLVKEGIVAGCKAAEARGQELGKLLGAG